MQRSESHVRLVRHFMHDDLVSTLESLFLVSSLDVACEIANTKHCRLRLSHLGVLPCMLLLSLVHRELISASMASRQAFYVCCASNHTTIWMPSTQSLACETEDYAVDFAASVLLRQ